MPKMNQKQMNEFRESTREYCQQSDVPFTESDIDKLLADPVYLCELVSCDYSNRPESEVDRTELFTMIYDKLSNEPMPKAFAREDILTDAFTRFPQEFAVYFIKLQENYSELDLFKFTASLYSNEETRITSALNLTKKVNS